MLLEDFGVLKQWRRSVTGSSALVTTQPLPALYLRGGPSKVGWQVGDDTCRCYLFVPI